MVRDDRASGGVETPEIIYRYMTGRGGMWEEKLLGDYHGILQVDGYEAYGQFGKAGRPGGPSVLAYCWAHVRRGFFDAGGKGDGAPIATEALHRIALLYDIEREIHGRSEEHTSELQSLMRISYAVFCLKKKKQEPNHYL